MDNNKPQTSNSPAARQDKKTYVKPTYQSEEVFETMALSCGKVQSTQGQCHMNRKNS